MLPKRFVGAIFGASKCIRSFSPQRLNTTGVEYKSLITEGLCLCLKNGVIKLFGIVTPLMMFYFLQMANLGKCADLAQEMLLQLLMPIILIWFKEPIKMATMYFVEPRYSMSFKQMEYAICSLCCHDASVLQTSSMLTTLSVLHVNNDPLRPVKCCTKKAYGHTRHLQLLHTDLEL
jgi:hypothetical protein